MRRIPYQIQQNAKIPIYLKDVNIHSNNSRSNKVSNDKMPTITNHKLQANLKLKNKDTQQNRSVSELSKKYETTDVYKGTNNSPTIDYIKNNIKLRLPKLESQENQLIQSKTTQKPLQRDTNNTASMNLETIKKKKLLPLKHQHIMSYSKSKAGSTGKQTKINQDAIIIQHKLPHNLKLFCVCDGHGLNGHHVSNFIKANLVISRENLTKLLKKHQQQIQNIVPLLQNAFEITNQELLDSEINTDLSGSTVVAVFIYKNKIYCFNVGDSRAILLSNIENSWKIKPLSNDQKPSRQDEKERILKFGGRIQAQKDENGNQLGPLRVWMQNVQMPGLAMTRSFGDKAGMKAGTNGIPEVLQHQITFDDKLIIVASDGIWEYIENEQLMELIVPFYVKNTLELGCERVVNHAISVWRKVCFSRDDISIIAISINEM